MARIPVKLGKSTREREVTVIVYVDGQEYVQETRKVEEWAIPHVASAVIVQIDDPDYEGARDD